MVRYGPRRHGWQPPLHPLQMVGMGVYTLLVASFYCFILPFIGHPIAHLILLSLFSSLAVSVMVLFIRCTATDPSDKSRYPRKPHIKSSSAKSQLNYGLLIRQILRRWERRILKNWIRRKYVVDPRFTPPLNPREPLLPLLLAPEDAPPSFKDEDLSFCSFCNFQVKKHSKHCRTCNRCVEGFDHHCRWLNNCVGKKNYTSFILLMISVLLLLLTQGGSSIAVFVRCFAYKKRIEDELVRVLHVNFPRALLVAISVVLFVITAYGSAALGQLFFFHLLLIRKGMRTYDYILAMKEEYLFTSSQLFNDSDLSSEDSSEPDSPKSPIVMSQFVCSGPTNPSPGRLAVKIDPGSATSTLNQNQRFRATIDPWKLIEMSRDKAFMAAEKAKERLAKEKEIVNHELLNPLPSEMKSGPLVKPERDLNIAGLSLTPLVAKGRVPSSPGRFSSPRRRFSGSSAALSAAVGLPNQKFRSNFDLKLTEVSRELESYISRQVLCSVLKDGTEASPR